MALGDWDGDAEQWDLDSDAWEFAVATLTETVTVTAAEVGLGTSTLDGVTESVTATESIVPASSVIPPTLSDSITVTDTLAVQALPQGVNTEGVTITCSEIGEVLSPVGLSETGTFTETWGIESLVLESIDDLCILDEIWDSLAGSTPESLIEDLTIEGLLFDYIDGWSFDHERANGSWSQLGSRSDVWSKSGGTSSDWQGDVPL